MTFRKCVSHLASSLISHDAFTTPRFIKHKPIFCYISDIRNDIFVIKNKEWKLVCIPIILQRSRTEWVKIDMTGVRYLQWGLLAKIRDICTYRLVLERGGGIALAWLTWLLSSGANFNHDIPYLQSAARNRPQTCGWINKNSRPFFPPTPKIERPTEVDLKLERSKSEEIVTKFWMRERYFLRNVKEKKRAAQKMVEFKIF